MPHKLFYQQAAGVLCQNNLWGDTNKRCTLHAYLHADKLLQFYSGCLHGHLTRYAELLLESMLASLGTSVTAFLLPGQVTLQEARSGPKTATRYPAERAARPRQRPTSFTRPVTLQQCVGGFFYAMGEWNLSPAGSYWHLCGWWAGEGRGPAEEEWGVCVWYDKGSVELKHFLNLDLIEQNRTFCTYGHVYARKPFSEAPYFEMPSVASISHYKSTGRWLSDLLTAFLSMCEHLRPALCMCGAPQLHTGKTRIIEGHCLRGHATAGTLWLILLLCGPSRLVPWASTHGKKLCHIPLFPPELLRIYPPTASPHLTHPFILHPYCLAWQHSHAR